MKIKVIDNVLSEKFLKDIERPVIFEKPWFLNYDNDFESRSVSLGQIVKRNEFSPVEFYFLKKLEEQKINTSRIVRCFYNCFRKCDTPKYHKDPGGTTYMFYLNKEWNKLWGAPTKFKMKNYHVPKLIFPKPGRLVIFDANILHKGTAPNIFMPDKHPGRLSIAFHET